MTRRSFLAMFAALFVRRKPDPVGMHYAVIRRAYMTYDPTKSVAFIYTSRP